MEFSENPKDSDLWIILSRYRNGLDLKVPMFGNFKCDVLDCNCQFSNVIDWIIHRKRGQHGPLGGPQANQKRFVFKYFYRGDRLKEQLYRKQSQNENGNVQQSL